MASEVNNASDITTTNNDEEVNFGGGRPPNDENEYFELRIPENVVELQQQTRTLSEQDLNELNKFHGNIESIKLEVFKCKSCKYRCIFREEILQHMKNVHYEMEKDMSSIATVIDVLMQGLSSQVQKSQQCLELNDVGNNSSNTTNTKQTSDGHTVLQNVVDKIVMQEVMSTSQEEEESFDSSEQLTVENNSGADGYPEPTIPFQIPEVEPQISKKDINPILHSGVDLTAIAKSAAECNPNATRITVFQHLNNSDTPTAIHFRKSRKSDAIIPTNDSLGISSPFLNNEYRGKKHFACSQCHSRYKTEKELANHVQKKHKRDESVLCEICGLELASQVCAKYHATRMHKSKGELMSCDKCDYVTRFEKRLEIHRAKHQSEFYCVACKKSYVSQQKLERHYQSPMHKHIINPLICEHCGYSSNKKDNFLVHMRKHTGEKPYKCNHCPYASADGSTLKKHVMAKHSNIRPFKCQICSFSSVDKKGLTVHVRKHTGERPFCCKHCSYAAKRRSALKVHMQTHIQISDKKVAEENSPIKIVQQPRGPTTYAAATGIPEVLQNQHHQPRRILPTTLLPAENHAPNPGGALNQVPSTGVIQNQAPNTGVLQIQVLGPNVMQNQAPNPGDMQTTSTGVIQIQAPSTGVMQNQVPSTGVMQIMEPSTGVKQNQAPNTGVMQNQLHSTGVVHIQAPNTGVMQNQLPSTGVMQNQLLSTGVMQIQTPNTGVMQNQAPNTGVMQIQAPSGVVQNQTPSTVVMQTQSPNTVVMQSQTPGTVVMQTQSPNTGAVQSQTPGTVVMQTQSPNTGAVQSQVSTTAAIQNLAHNITHTGVVQSPPVTNTAAMVTNTVTGTDPSIRAVWRNMIQ